jgi:hypothetical protein
MYVNVRPIPNSNIVVIKTDKIFGLLKTAPKNDFGAKLQNDCINVVCDLNNYSAVIQKLTKYLEEIIFNLMVIQEEKEDGNKNTSADTGTKSAGNKSEHKPGSTGKDKSKKSKSILSGILNSSRGDELPEGN